MSEKNELTNATPKRSFKPTEFLLDVLRGAAIGVAFIIPGFSGGSVAAILGIYEKLVGAIADIFKSFKKSIITLLPIFLGMVVGIVSLLYPLGWALEKFPLPTVCLFVGLAIGGLPSITEKIKGKPSLNNLLALFIPLLFAAALVFLPVGKDVNLLNIGFGGYVVLFLVGLLGSSALVVPGISGSMLLLILGYYNPIIHIVTDNLLKGDNVIGAILVLLSCGLGILVGFILISYVMKLLLARYKRGTYFAIVGFIIGSIPTIFASTAKEAAMTFATLPSSAVHWIMCALLLAVGIALSYSFVRFCKKEK